MFSAFLKNFHPSNSLRLLLFAFIFTQFIQAAPIATQIWVVRTDGTPPASAFLSKVNAVNKGEMRSLQGFYPLDFSKSTLEPKEIEAMLDAHESFLWFERQFKDQITKPVTIPGNPLQNPRLSDSWHITNAGQSKGKRGEDLNLMPAWDRGLDGSGVLIAVVDEGTELKHPDLISNIRADLALNLVGSLSNPYQLDTDESHGTAVSGIIAATDNEIGGVGVSYGAHLVPIRYLGTRQTDENTAEALGHNREIISIYNNSWGLTLDADEDFVAMIAPSSLGKSSVIKSVRVGRGGLGSIFVFAAGNDASFGANVNYNGWANMRETIAVAAIGNSGKWVSYSEPGAPVLVCAPSGGQSRGIFTTDRTGSLGYDPTNYTSTFSGTSAATPMVSGVIALMLEANPQLSWRDVQHILVKTAIQVDPDDDDWQVNGAGLHINHKYGFGRVDASSAVQTAQSWQKVRSETSTAATRSSSSLIPDNDARGVVSSVNINRNIRVEHVYLSARFNHTDWGNLAIILTSPSGTKSVLAYPHTDKIKAYDSWVYTTVRNWDEESEGLWTLEVIDAVPTGIGQMEQWTITIYGTEIQDNDNLTPVAEPDEYLNKIYPATIPVLANDSDSDGDPLYVISLYQAEFGELSITPNQEITYTPGEDFIGIDRFGYSISDGKGGTSDTQVNIVHPGPVPMRDQVTVEMNKSVSIPVLANDFDRSGDMVELVSVDDPDLGTATVLNSHVIYTPTPAYVGKQTFEYTITDNNDGEKSGKIDVYISASNDFSLLFDGVDDHIKINASASLDVTETITMEARFYLRSYGEYGKVGFGRILDRGTYSMFVNGTNHAKYPDHALAVAFDIDGEGTITANTVGDTISLNQWHTVAVTYNGTNIKMYVDGKSVEVQTLFGEISGSLKSDPTSELFIGESSSNERAFDGLIDWVKIWNIERPASKLSSSTTAVAKDDRNGLVGWWQFLEGVNDIANDSVDTNPGTVFEALWSPTDPSLISSLFE